jgi:ABC-type glycerol-3-phosphate transport system permease component
MPAVRQTRGQQCAHNRYRFFLEEDFTNYGALMAGVTLASLPALLVFGFLQRRVMDAFIDSGVKG